MSEQCTNALAELAFRIDAAHTEMIACEIPKQYCEYVETAKRIVDELAKVEDWTNDLGADEPRPYSSVSAIKECRAIAAEGVK